MKKVYIAAAILIFILILTKFKPAKKKNLSIKQVSEIENKRILSDLHPAVKARFNDLLTAIKNMGFTPILTSGYRSFQKQKTLKDQDSRNAAPGYSSHNYGMALDLCLFKNGQTWNKNTPPEKWNLTGVPQMAKKMGFRWGGDFQGYPDTVHFDLQNDYPTAALYKKAVKQFGDIENIKGNEVKLT